MNRLIVTGWDRGTQRRGTCLRQLVHSGRRETDGERPAQAPSGGLGNPVAAFGGQAGWAAGLYPEAGGGAAAAERRSIEISPRLVVGGMSDRSPTGDICVWKKIVWRGATAVICRSTSSCRSGAAGGQGWAHGGR